MAPLFSPLNRLLIHHLGIDHSILHLHGSGKVPLGLPVYGAHGTQHLNNVCSTLNLINFRGVLHSVSVNIHTAFWMLTTALSSCTAVAKHLSCSGGRTPLMW